MLVDITKIQEEIEKVIKNDLNITIKDDEERERMWNRVDDAMYPVFEILKRYDAALEVAIDKKINEQERKDGANQTTSIPVKE